MPPITNHADNLGPITINLGVWETVHLPLPLANILP